MQQSIMAQDKEGVQYYLRAPVLLGYPSRACVEIVGYDGITRVPSEAFESLAVAYLRSMAYLVIDSSEVVNGMIEKTAQLAQQGAK